MALDNENHLTGFIISQRWQDPTPVPMPTDYRWIQVLVVSEKESNKGIGSLLLEKAENVLKADGAKEILLGSDPLHYFLSIPAEYENSARWFERTGYASIGNE